LLYYIKLFYIPIHFLCSEKDLTADEVTRGTRKTFTVYITDLDGNPQDPDSCTVTFVKAGEYGYDSPRGPYTCSKVGTTGYWGADVLLRDTMTLGDWVAVYAWYVSGVKDGDEFPFIVVDKRRPWINTRPTPVNVKVVG